MCGLYRPTMSGVWNGFRQGNEVPAGGIRSTKVGHGPGVHHYGPPRSDITSEDDQRSDADRFGPFRGPTFAELRDNTATECGAGCKASLLVATVSTIFPQWPILAVGTSGIGTITHLFTKYCIFPRMGLPRTRRALTLAFSEGGR